MKLDKITEETRPFAKHQIDTGKQFFHESFEKKSKSYGRQKFISEM